MNTKNGTILLAAGGTGGHIYPAHALRKVLKSRGWNVIFITDQRGLNFRISDENIEIYRINSASLSGSLSDKLIGIFKLIFGLVQSFTLIKRFKPAAVVGFGGYPSVPTMVAATLIGCPTMIHEQNAVLGRANRLVARRVNRIATAFSAVSGIKQKYKSKVTLTGNPSRPDLVNSRQHELKKPFTILVIGGSQGASILSKIVPGAVCALPPDLRKNLIINQQCRPEDLQRVQNAYNANGITSTLSTFFQDIPKLMSEANLVISRAGASTIAELTIVGRASILIPYASAMDDHQTANAKNIADNGGAWMIPQAELTVDVLCELLISCLTSPSLLSDVGNKASKCGSPDAAIKLAESVEEIAAISRERIG